MTLAVSKVRIKIYFIHCVTRLDKKPNIEIKNLNVTYFAGKSNEVRALENINLEIFPQEYVIIFGPSGCGKSTLLYTIAGLEKATSGQVFVDGSDIGRFPKKSLVDYHRDTIGMIFQAFHLINSLNIIDNVCLPRVFKGEEIVVRRELSKKLLDRFDILPQAYKLPSELSGGQKQRVSIARSLINNPNIILADEPVGNLDSKSSYNVMSILKDLNEVDKKTIILVTHDPTHLQYGDKVVYMRDGKVVKIDKVLNKKAPEESKGVEVVERQEEIPADLRLLMRAFKNFSPAQVGTLIVPFKAQQLFSHIFMQMTDEQAETAKKKLREYLFSSITQTDLEKELDEDLEKGGAGWDKRNARTFVAKVEQIVSCAGKINYSDIAQSAVVVTNYLDQIFSLHLEDDKKVALASIISLRLQNRIAVDELEKKIDAPVSEDGLAIDKRTAHKLAREIEILLLLRYSA